jgi:hypothetical protein
MGRVNEITVKYCDEIPESIKEGIIYMSHKFKLAIHLCACGCKEKTVTPFSKIIDGVDIGWHVIEDNGKITLSPSIGNFSGENPYHAHYFIKENKIDWL